MSGHVTPYQCLSALVQQISDGGRSEYLDQEASIDRESDPPQGDCAIVAAVHASFQRPSGQAYGDVRLHLGSGINPRVFSHREHGESIAGFMLRRIRQLFRSPSREPMHGTPNRATRSYLLMLGYRDIQPNASKQWPCICDPYRSFYVDMLMPQGGHAICVQQGIAYSTVLFDPEEIKVLNVLGLGPEETANFRALRRYDEDQEAWLDRMIESPDWNWDRSSEPKLDDYLKN